MQSAFVQMENLLGREKTERLARAKIAVFGLGPAGAAAAETLARCGVGSLTLADPAVIREEDICIHPAALTGTVGHAAAAVMKERIRQIDEDILVHTYETPVTEDTIRIFHFASFDYVIETLSEASQKLRVILSAHEAGVPVISCMETGNLADAGRLTAADLFRSGTNGLARELKDELKKAGIRSQKAVFSKEKPKEVTDGVRGSIVYVPYCAGLLLAQEAVRTLTADGEENHKSTPVRLPGMKNGGKRIGFPKPSRENKEEGNKTV